MQITMSDGRVFSGTPIQIVQGMRSVAFDKRDASLSEYINWVVGNVERNEGVALSVTGDTDDERSASLIQAMRDAGLAK